GARFVGLHERSADDDLRFVLQDAEATLLVVDDRVHPGRDEALSETVTVECTLTHQGAVGPGLWDLAQRAEPGPPRCMAEAADVARLAYTGGTTGRPKGVLLTHRALVSNTLMTLAEIPWPAEMRFVTGAPITHGAGSYVLPTFIRGGSVILLEHFTVDGFLDAVEQHRVTAA